MSYRQRCYEVYSSTQFNKFHTFDRKEYDSGSKVLAKRFNKFLISNKNGPILDIACGAGHFLNYIKQEGYTDAYGIDLSKEQLDIARKMGITNVEEADLFEFLPKCPGKYELITAGDIIEHLTKDEIIKFLDLIHGALKPGGRVLIRTNNGGSLFSNIARYCDVTHELVLTALSLSQVLQVCRFENINIYGEEPVVTTYKSQLRAWGWKFIKLIMRFYLLMENGTDICASSYKTTILDPRIFAVCEKPLSSK